MSILAREDFRPRRHAAALLLLLAALGCGADGGPPLQVVDRHSLAADAGATLFAAADGTVWIGGPGEVRAIPPAGAARRIPVGGSQPARVVGEAGGRLLVRVGPRLVSLDPGGGAPRAERDVGRGAVLVDVRERYVIVVAPDGEARGLDPASLEPLWVWPSLGAAAAAAASPEGDRVYVAVADGEGAALVTRDLQTGRSLAAEALPAELVGLGIAWDGTLLALSADALAALEPGGGGWRARWRKRLRSLGLAGDAEAEVRAAPGSARLVVLSPGSEAGLRVLDAETGEPRGRVAGPVLDAAFAPGGDSLYLLTPSGIGAARVP